MLTLGRPPPLLLFPKTFTSYIYKSEKLAIQLHSDVHSEICSGVCSGIHLYPLLFSYPSLSIHFPHPADSTPCHFPQSSPAQHHFGHPSHVHIMSATQIQTTHNKNTILTFENSILKPQNTILKPQNTILKPQNNNSHI